jgi:pimeloyl-ACP methyl ester carboxylesterase
LLVDLLGFGFADRPEQFGYSMEEHADCLAALLDHLELQGCRVVGHSMGGSIAIVLATRRPDLVAALAVAEGNLDPGRASASVRITAQTEPDYVRAGHAALSSAFARNPASTSAYGGAARSFQLAAAYAIYRSARSLLADRQPTFRQLLEGLAIPRTYLVGELSLPDFPEGPVPGNGVAVTVVADAGHGMNVDNPEGFVQALAAAFSLPETGVHATH